MKSKIVLSLLFLLLAFASAQTTQVKLESLPLTAALTAPADIYSRGNEVVIDFALGLRQPRNCTLEKLESPQGEILAFGTVNKLGNGLTLRYDISFSTGGSGGTEGKLEGLLLSNSQLYKVTGHTQTELGVADPSFCIEVFENLTVLPSE